MAQQKKVVWIVGMAYSGSSLLNILLDTQPTIRAIGEGAQVYRPGMAGGPCARCRDTCDQCTLYSRYNGGPFYQFNFNRYGSGCNVLVDSSKSSRTFLDKPFEESFRYFVVLLSKTPHEAAYSLLQHGKWDYWHPDTINTDVSKCFESYRNVYLSHFGNLAQLGMTEFLRVRFRDIAADRIAAVKRICDFVEEPFSEERLRADWWTTDTHVLGGNPAILAQVSGDDSLAYPCEPDEYLNGKYIHRTSTIFLDDAWRQDRAFVQECRREYKRRRREFDKLLHKLNHGSVDDMLADMRLPQPWQQNSAPP